MKDWCTAFPDRIKDYDISGCCHMHDDRYAEISKLPILKRIVERYKADYELMQ